MPAEMSHLSTEYVDVPITSNITLAGGTAEVAFTAANAEPSDVDWITASIVQVSGVSTFTAKVRILVGPFTGEYEAPSVGDYQEWVRVTALTSPERPVRKAGILSIV